MRPHSLFLALALAVLALGAIPASAADLLSIDPFCGVARLGLRGDMGANYTIEGSDVLEGAAPWTPLLDLTLTTGMTSWCDSEARNLTRRFYRAIRLNAPPPQLRPRNFRLNDHAGRSHELYYSYSDATVVAYVLVFTGTTCSNLQSDLSALKALSTQYEPLGVHFWIIDSLPGNNRSNLIAEASSLRISTIPVLHDRAQLVTREFGITRVPEVVVIENGTFESLYRGPVQEVSGTHVEPYLAGALETFLAGRTVTPSRVRPIGAEAGVAIGGVPDYASEIAPLLQSRCIQCHSPGNIAPWSMTNHAVVQLYADSMKDEVLAARMPPWHADPHVGRFSNDSSLQPEESARLIRWLDAGAPRGDGPDPLETTATEPPEWPFGTPDLVLSIPSQSLPATGDVDYRYITVKPNLSTDVWLRAAVVRPGNRKVVHHSLVFLGSAGNNLNGLAGYFAGYVPGLEPSIFPDGSGKLLPKGTNLTFQMHYISTGTPQTDQTQLGLYFLSLPPKKKLQTKAAYDIFFSIPAMNRDYPTVVFSSVFLKASWLYEVSPHQHLRGTRFKYELELPTGTRTPLINIPKYLFSWQRLYRFADPVLIPKGARIVCTGAWDNSPQNLTNPDPSSEVRFGEQTYEEMFIGYYNYAEIP